MFSGARPPTVQGALRIVMKRIQNKDVPYEHSLYVWKVSNCEWMFQTDRPEIKRKMMRKAGFDLVGWGYNCNLWVYKKTYFKPYNALRGASRITGREMIFDRVKLLYYAENGSASVHQNEDADI